MVRPRTGIGFVQHGVLYTGVRLKSGRRWVRPVAEVAPPPEGIPANVIWAKAVSMQLQARHDRGEWSPGTSPRVEQVTFTVAPAPAPSSPVATPKATATVAARSKTAPQTATSAGGETVSKWFVRWLEDRRAKGSSTVRTDGSRFRSQVEPVLGGLPIKGVAKDDIEQLVTKLDEGIRGGGSWRTAWNGWALTRAMFRDASRSKNALLRVREDNPCEGVAPPDRGVKKVKAYIMPTEFLALVSSDDVPLRARRLYAIAVYLYARPGELEALEWEDLDLERGTVHIHRAIHYDTGEIKPVKTQEARRFSIERNLLPLLRALHDAREGRGRVLDAEVPKEGAEQLRAHLKVAGVTRADLFANDATRKPMTFYDLRATGITWRAIRGDEPLRIQRAAGHTGFDTTQGYIREAESVKEGFGEVFPPLPEALLTGAGAQRLRARRSDASPRG